MADDAQCPVPPEIQAAVDAGRKEEVEELLKTAPEAMSKAQKKKLLKNAEIAAKKLEKQASKPTNTSQPAPSAKQPKSDVSSATSAPAPASGAQGSGVMGKAESTLVEVMLARLEALGLPSDALELCRQQKDALGLALVPHVNTLLNQAYTEGFNARA